MFFINPHPIALTVLTAIGAALLAFYLPVILKKTGISKHLSQGALDVTVGLLMAYAVLSVLIIIGVLFVWLANMGGPFGNSW